MIETKDAFSLTKEQEMLLPSEEDVLFYEEHGWYASPVVIPEEVINEAIIGAEEFYKGKRDFTLSNSDRIANDDVDKKVYIRNNEFVTLQKKEIQALGFHPMIGAIAAKLARTPSIRLFADSLICKFPAKDVNQGIVGWHTDKAYWPTCSSDNMLTAWIPLQDCTIDMGTLLHIEKSHLWKDEKAFKTYYSFNSQDLSGLEDFMKEQKPDYSKKEMLLKKGQVSFHSCHTIHSSSPNRSDSNRLALAVHLQDNDNHYQKAYKENGDLIEIGYDKMCRKDENGNSDYSDNTLFPVLWSEQS